MSSVTRVPVLTDPTESPRSVLGRAGWKTIAKESFVRLRYGDGFTSARALGFQLSLSIIPLGISLVGLGATLGAGRPGEVVRRTLQGLTPGGSGDAVRASITHTPHGQGGTLALTVGLVGALISLTTTMGQIERGANRIYGIQRDRGAREKYSRAGAHALSVGLALLVGFLLLVGGERLGRAVSGVYHSGGTGTTLACWASGTALLISALIGIFERAPRRVQPGRSWLAAGALVALGSWLGLTGGLAEYLSHSSGFGRVYGPLTGVVALLLWAQLSSIALLYGVAVAAQLEAHAGGVKSAAGVDPEEFGNGGISPVLAARTAAARTAAQPGKTAGG